MEMRDVLKPRVPALAAALALAALALASGHLWAEAGDFGELIERKGAAAKEVIESPTLYRVAELPGMPCSAETFDFLLDRPRTSIALAGKMHKSLDKYKIDVRPGGSFHIDDGGKLVGDMELVSRCSGRRVYYISGYWKLVMGIRLEGRMALVTEYKETKTPQGPVLDARARGYMLVDNSVAGAAFRLAAYLFPGKVDARIKRFATAVRKVTIAVHDDPAGVYRRLLEGGHVPPGEAEDFRRKFLSNK